MVLFPRLHNWRPTLNTDIKDIVDNTDFVDTADTWTVDIVDIAHVCKLFLPHPGVQENQAGSFGLPRLPGLEKPGLDWICLIKLNKSHKQILYFHIITIPVPKLTSDMWRYGPSSNVKTSILTRPRPSQGNTCVLLH